MCSSNLAYSNVEFRPYGETQESKNTGIKFKIFQEVKRWNNSLHRQSNERYNSASHQLVQKKMMQNSNSFF